MSFVNYLGGIARDFVAAIFSLALSMYGFQLVLRQELVLAVGCWLVAAVVVLFVRYQHK